MYFSSVLGIFFAHFFCRGFACLNTESHVLGLAKENPLPPVIAPLAGLLKQYFLIFSFEKILSRQRGHTERQQAEI